MWDFCEEICLVENYENYGDDGHIDMRLTGYVFVPLAGIEMVDFYGRRFRWQHDCYGVGQRVEYNQRGDCLNDGFEQWHWK